MEEFIIIFIIVLIVIFLIARQFWCWYWKINARACLKNKKYTKHLFIDPFSW